MNALPMRSGRSLALLVQGFPSTPQAAPARMGGFLNLAEVPTDSFHSQKTANLLKLSENQREGRKAVM